MTENAGAFSSLKPYMLRAFYEWCGDNDYTPLIVVDVVKNPDKLKVPMGYAIDNRIALDISPEAVRNLEMENDHIAFDATFGGVGEHVYVPFENVIVILADEIKQGLPMMDPSEVMQSGKKPTTGRKKPTFTEVTD